MVEVIDWAVTDAPLAKDCSSKAGLAAAIGNFDGVHRGHQKVVAAATEAARRDNLTSAVITFDPHPREFFRQDDAPFYLADRKEKDRLLSDLLVQSAPAKVIHVRFDDALRKTDAHRFISNVLVSLRVRIYLQGLILLLEKGGVGILRQSIGLARMLVSRQPLSRSLLMIILRSFPLAGYEQRCKLVILSWQH